MVKFIYKLRFTFQIQIIKLFQWSLQCLDPTQDICAKLNFISPHHLLQDSASCFTTSIKPFFSNEKMPLYRIIQVQGQVL